MRQSILIIRFSALGDVAMSLPVVVAFARQNPQIEVYVLSRMGFSSLFQDLEKNIRFIGADFQKEHKGLSGLWLLFKQVRAVNPGIVLDLHGVLRSYFLRTLFFLSGKKVRGISKGRKEKQAITRKRNKIVKPLKSVFERYSDVFLDAGFDFKPDPLYSFETKTQSTIVEEVVLQNNRINIGIAPFAKHQGKIYPAIKMFKLLEMLAAVDRFNVFLFGGGKTETMQMQEWQESIPELHIIAGKYNLREELGIMKSMHLMITMDSANMHLASLTGTRVISVWGATHPFAGFRPWMQDEDDCIQCDLECRPCSVYGNKACFRKDYACLNGIDPDMIYKRIEQVI